ncbi:hypothetical protein DL93DRAFT_2223454 [Clavulina sp. PMI_390]|nr:hypothetical protein DL93DRAFT_2223454 [Clavulina sp. PMI_390]
MSRRLSRDVASSAEAIEAAAHPDGVLRGLAVRRAFTEVIMIQAVCRGHLTRTKLSSSFLKNRIRSFVDPHPPVLSPLPLTPPQTSAEGKPEPTFPPAAPLIPTFTGPEHTLIHLAICVKTVSKEISNVKRSIDDTLSSISLREARVQNVEAHVASMQATIGNDHVPIRKLDALQEQVDDANRELDGWIAREAARKGQLIQLRTQVHAKAKLQAQWHRRRSTLPAHEQQHHAPFEAEQMFRESITRATLYVAAACRERVLVAADMPRDLSSKTRVKLNRTMRSPFAPPPKSVGRSASIRSKEQTKTRRSARPPAADHPPSAFPTDSGLQNEVPLGDDEDAMFTPQRRTRPVSVVVPDHNREEMNARLADFYVPRSRSSSVAAIKTPPPPVDNTPTLTAAALLEQIPSSVFDGPDTKLDLDLKIPSVLVPPRPPRSKHHRRRSSSTPASTALSPKPEPDALSPPSSFRVSASSPPSSPTTRVKFSQPSPSVVRRISLSRRGNRSSMPPTPLHHRSGPPPTLAPLALAGTHSFTPPGSNSNSPKLPAEPAGPPNAAGLPPSPARLPLTESFRTSTAAFARSPPNLKSLSIDPSKPVPEWISDLLGPLQQQPPLSPSTGAPQDLVLDLHIPNYAPSPTSTKDEWDLVNTSPFADRESFRLSAPTPPLVQDDGSPTTPGISLGAQNGRPSTSSPLAHPQNPRVAKLRNRASYILPKRNGGPALFGFGEKAPAPAPPPPRAPRPSSMALDASAPTNSSSTSNGKVPGQSHPPPVRTAVDLAPAPKDGGGGKWRKRLSLTGILPGRGGGAGSSNQLPVDLPSGSKAKKSSSPPVLAR